MNAYEQTVADVLRADDGVILGIVYGSAAAGRVRPDSDIDVAVLKRQPLEPDERLSLIARLEEAVRKPVDLVDLARVNGGILRQILGKGRVVLKRDRSAYRALAVKMVDQQTDFQPLVNRTLLERQRRFAHG